MSSICFERYPKQILTVYSSFFPLLKNMNVHTFTCSQNMHFSHSADFMIVMMTYQSFWTSLKPLAEMEKLLKKVKKGQRVHVHHVSFLKKSRFVKKKGIIWVVDDNSNLRMKNRAIWNGWDVEKKHDYFSIRVYEENTYFPSSLPWTACLSILL